MSAMFSSIVSAAYSFITSDISYIKWHANNIENWRATTIPLFGRKEVAALEKSVDGPEIVMNFQIESHPLAETIIQVPFLSASDIGAYLEDNGKIVASWEQTNLNKSPIYHKMTFKFSSAKFKNTDYSVRVRKSDGRTEEWTDSPRNFKIISDDTLGIMPTIQATITPQRFWSYYSLSFLLWLFLFFLVFDILHLSKEFVGLESVWVPVVGAIGVLSTLLGFSDISKFPIKSKISKICYELTLTKPFLKIFTFLLLLFTTSIHFIPFKCILEEHHFQSKIVDVVESGNRDYRKISSLFRDFSNRVEPQILAMKYIDSKRSPANRPQFQHATRQLLNEIVSHNSK
jgi:hypothetical protein